MRGRPLISCEKQYLIGDAEYLDVLSAITGQQSLQRQLLSARLELVLIRVTLYRALAGDFDTRPQLTAQLLPDIQNEFDPVAGFEQSEDSSGTQNLEEAESVAEVLVETNGND